MSDEDFCLIHGHDFMTRDQIPQCTKCNSETPPKGDVAGGGGSDSQVSAAAGFPTGRSATPSSANADTTAGVVSGPSPAESLREWAALLRERVVETRRRKHIPHIIESPEAETMASDLEEIAATLASPVPSSPDATGPRYVSEQDSRLLHKALIASTEAVEETVDATALKGCPFCGSENLRRNSVEGIECRACHIEFYATGNELDADAWNRRAPPSPQVTREGERGKVVGDWNSAAHRQMYGEVTGDQLREYGNKLAAALTAADERITALERDLRSVSRDRDMAWATTGQFKKEVATAEASLAERDATIARVQAVLGIDMASETIEAALQAVIDQRREATTLLETAVRAAIEAAHTWWGRDRTGPSPEVGAILAQITDTGTK